MKFFNDISNKVLNEVCKLKLTVSKESPTILLVGGIGAVVGGTIMAIKASGKASDCMDEFDSRMKRYREAVEIADKRNDGEEFYPVATRKRDVQIIYGHMMMTMAKIYLPAIMVEAAGIFMICKSHSILNKRYGAMAAAYAALSKSFEDYRKRVAERYGAEVEKSIYYGFDQKSIEEVQTGDNGVSTTTTKDITTANPLSPYSKFIDQDSGIWEKNPQYTLQNILVQQRTANDLLWTRGFLTLNDVYRLLDLPQTTDGMILGWIKDPNNEQKINFGLYETNREATRRFVNGYEDVVLVDFNIDGNIYQKMMDTRKKEKNEQR